MVNAALRQPGTIFIIPVIVCLVSSYLYKNDIPLISQARALDHSPTSKMDTTDEFRRNTDLTNKTQLSCPSQNKRTGIILVIGQSNSANYGELYTTIANQSAVFNYWNGACYDALPPLLGASGNGGSFAPLLASKLISDGVYDKVVIVSSGIGGTNVARWGAGGDLHAMLRGVLRNLAKDYAITDVIWHQGEADFIRNTSSAEYQGQFRSLVAMIREHSPNAVDIYIAIASRCHASSKNPWRPDNATTEAQMSLVAAGVAFLGVDSDELISDDRRLSDKCHLNLAGEDALANAYAEAIRNKKQKTSPTEGDDISRRRGD